MAVNLSIKNVPDEVAERLRDRAARHHRSLQGELLAIVEAAVGHGERLSLEELARRVRARRARTPSESTRIIRRLRDSR